MTISSAFILSVLSSLFINIGHSQLQDPNLPCVDVISSPSGTRDDDKATVSCSDHPDNDVRHYTLVSCGWQAVTKGDEHMDGGYMSDDAETCIAINGNGGGGIQATARCCDFRGVANVNCKAGQAGGVFGDDSRQTRKCGDNISGFTNFNDYPHLTGCYAWNHWGTFDGAYPGQITPDTVSFHLRNQLLDERCTVRGGTNSNPTYNQMTCCNVEPLVPSLNDFHCQIRYTDESSLSSGESVAKCPTVFTMIGCSGWGYYRSLSRQTILTGSDGVDRCYAGTDKNSDRVYATAICCRFQ